ncbi:ATP synthase subunit O, mitochondrial [Plutella xylostella]|uniref:ATP synthase subunit O, mitochondrial n=1 Tax=Plutella xylostella TaxID=51655 RepID=UPI002032B81D|nr:ATP synthase subunit O, mitochondrial [Plutella xylostella]
MAKFLSQFRRTMCSAATSNITLQHKPPVPVFGIEGRYVSALYSAAHQMNQLDDVEKHCKALQTEVGKPVVKDYFESSMQSRIEKAKFLHEFAKSAGMPDSLANFLQLVAENGRLKMLRKMINMFLIVMVAHRNEALCEVITATPLEEGDRAALMETLKKFVQDKKITLTEKVDPSIMGGMIVGVDDKHVDLSIKRKMLLYTEILKQAL